MSPLKGVRFANDGLVSAKNQWAVPDFAPAPTFSPTQVPAQERVLHSIFSPSYHKAKSSNSEEKQEAPKPPPSPYPQAIELFHTPQEISTPLRNRENREDNELFFSPHQVHNMSPMSAISGFTESRPSPPKATRQADVGENKASTSFNTLSTIDMLNFKYIEKCASIPDLIRVVKCLAEQKRHSPQLLQAANDRIAQLRGRSNGGVIMPSMPATSDTGESPGKYFMGGSSVNLSRITTGNTTMDSIEPSKGTLNFSLSPQSDLQGAALVDTPSATDSIQGLIFFPDTSSARLRPIAEVAKQSPVVEEGRELSEEMRELSKQAMDLETSQITDQESFVRQLEELEKVEKSAEKLMQTLDAKEKHQGDTRPPALVEEVQKIRKEQVETQKALEKERVALKVKNDEAKAVEKRLMQKISEISKELQTAQEHSRLAVGAERGLRLKREQELNIQTKRAQDLNRTLQETRDNVELLRQRHSQFRMELLRSMGTSFSELKDLSQQNFIATFSMKVKKMKEENEAMSKALKEAGQSKLSEENDHLNRHLRTVLTAKAKLEAQNRELSTQIKDLLEEVASSRAYIDKLLKTSHEFQLNDWEKREEQYKTVIQNLRQQVRKQTPTVSIELYKAAVDGSKQAEVELKKATTKISDLESKVNQLEKENLETRLLSQTAITPNQKVTFDRSGFLSPTDFLERGLLGAGARQDSPVQHSCSDLGNVEQQHSALPRNPLPRALEQNPQEAINKTEKVPSNLCGVQPLLSKTASQPEGIVPDSTRRAGLPLANIKAAAPPEMRVQERVHDDSMQALNFTKQRAEQSLMGMTISFRKNSCVASPLSETGSHRSRRNGKEDDVLTWVDKYTSNHRNVEGLREVNKTQPGMKKSSSSKREVRKGKGRDLRKAGSTRSQKMQIYVESGLGDNQENHNRQTTSRKVDRDPMSATKVQAQTQNNSTTKGSGRVLSSVSPKTKIQIENRKPSSMKGASKISTRIVKVRELGGKKGIQEKLKKMRSPPSKPLRSIIVN